MLDYQTTVELLGKAKLGDDGAKSTLISENMPLIKSIARRYRNKQVEYDDLLQLGALGLVKAINNFDLSFNVKFSTYAVPMIAGGDKEIYQRRRIYQGVESHEEPLQQDTVVCRRLLCQQLKAHCKGHCKAL